MKHRKILLGFVLLISACSVFADKNNPQFSDYSVSISKGPFAKKIALSLDQKNYTDKWQQAMQRELMKPVNFAGHYRLYLSWNGELPAECGDERWVCGWIIDKNTGTIVSELPGFNGNTHYRPYHANGTPVSEEFEPGFYPDSAMLWMNGNTAPLSNLDDLKCEYRVYVFKKNEFSLIGQGYPCDVDNGDGTSASQ